jgi:predicted  nucleic acid-binding Zn-ribbon protein
MINSKYGKINSEHEKINSEYRKINNEFNRLKKDYERLQSHNEYSKTSVCGHLSKVDTSLFWTLASPTERLLL